VCLEPDGTRARDCHPPDWLTAVPLVRPWVTHRVITARLTMNELAQYAADGGVP
jgi:hypothetical protein